jgi:hypothetical protein
MPRTGDLRCLRAHIRASQSAAVEYALDGQTFQLPTRATSTHQVCKRAVLEFRGKTLQPVNGQQLVIVNDPNGMQLQAQ